MAAAVATRGRHEPGGKRAYRKQWELYYGPGSLQGAPPAIATLAREPQVSTTPYLYYGNPFIHHNAVDGLDNLLQWGTRVWAVNGNWRYGWSWYRSRRANDRS